MKVDDDSVFFLHVWTILGWTILCSLTKKFHVFLPKLQFKNTQFACYNRNSLQYPALKKPAFLDVPLDYDFGNTG